MTQYVKYLYITCVCRIVTGSSRPFKAQMSYTYQLGDKGELLVVVTARDVSISAVSFRYIKIVTFFCLFLSRFGITKFVITDTLCSNVIF